MWRELREDVEDELTLLARTLDENAAEREDLLATGADQASEPSTWERGAAAMFVHQCYTGMENALKRIAKSVDRSLPDGPAWHAELLRQLAAPTADRPAVLSASLYTRLNESLGMRHVARVLYGFNLDWLRLRPHVEGLPALIRDFAAEMREFLDAMDRRVKQE